MTRPFSLGRPHPNHTPRVGRTRRGRSATFGRQVYGTTLRCSCGWLAYGSGQASNDPPSRGGRAEANRLYREHVSIEVDR